MLASCAHPHPLLGPLNSLSSQISLHSWASFSLWGSLHLQPLLEAGIWQEAGSWQEGLQKWKPLYSLKRKICTYGYVQTHTCTHTRAHIHTRTHRHTEQGLPQLSYEGEREKQPASSPTWAPISPQSFTGDNYIPSALIDLWGQSVLGTLFQTLYGRARSNEYFRK